MPVKFIPMSINQHNAIWHGDLAVSHNRIAEWLHIFEAKIYQPKDENKLRGG